MVTADLEATTEEEVELMVTADLEATTEEVELGVTAELEVTTEEEVELGVTELRDDQQILLI